MQYQKLIRKEVMKMWKLVNGQLIKALTALIYHDKDLAREVIVFEERVNSSEILIDSNCKNFISSDSFAPSDIEFIILTLKITMHLENLGDVAEEIAQYALYPKKNDQSKLLLASEVHTLFKNVLNILQKTLTASEAEDDNSSSYSFFAGQNLFGDLNWNNGSMIEFLKNASGDMEEALQIVSVIKTMEVLAEQSKCLCEENFIAEK